MRRPALLCSLLLLLAAGDPRAARAQSGGPTPEESTAVERAEGDPVPDTAQEAEDPGKGCEATVKRDVPYVTGCLTTEIQNDGTYRRRGGRRTNDLYTDSEFELEVRLSPNFAIVSHAHLEPVRDPPDGNRVFGDEGFYMEELYGKAEWERGGVRFGKFNPVFGSAQDRGVGIYGTDAAEDTYELTETLGVGPYAVFEGGPAKKSILSAGVFKRDNTWLSSSGITTPRIDEDRTARVGRNRVRYGGPGNTAYPTSATLALEAEELFQVKGLNATLGGERLARGRAEGDMAQYGAVAGLAYTTTIAPRWELYTIAEFAWLRHAEGARHDNYVPTLGVQATYDESWRFFASYAQFRRQATSSVGVAVLDDAGAPTGDIETRDIRQSALDRLYSAGIGYSVIATDRMKLDLDLAWVRKTSSNDGLDRETLRDGVGFRVHYEWRF